MALLDAAAEKVATEAVPEREAEAESEGHDAVALSEGAADALLDALGELDSDGRGEREADAEPLAVLEAEAEADME